MNAYESGARKVIPATLIYVRDAGDRILMIHRVGRDGDFHAGRWNGVGGKLEPDESPAMAARRELFEEAGIDLPESGFFLLGTILFPLFKPHKDEDWLVFVFTAQVEGRVRALPPCEEGELHWISAREVLALNLWPGDLLFLPFVLEERAFAGTIWYRDGNVARHEVREMRRA